MTVRIKRGRLATAAMSGAKAAAAMFDCGEGGPPPKAPAEFGDNAVYGATGFLAVLKGDVFVSATPPLGSPRSAEAPEPQLFSDDQKRAITTTLVRKGGNRRYPVSKACVWKRAVHLLKTRNESVDQVATPVAWAEGVTLRTLLRRRLGDEAASCDTLFQTADKYPSLRARP